MRIRPLNEKKYGVNKYQVREAANRCFQYPSWKRKLTELTGTIKAIQYDKVGRKSSSQVSQVEEAAIKRIVLEEKCKKVEQTVIEVDAGIYEWLLEGVTNENATYEYLKYTKGIPCERNEYYEKKREFYARMAKKIEKEPY